MLGRLGLTLPGDGRLCFFLSRLCAFLISLPCFTAQARTCRAVSIAPVRTGPPPCSQAAGGAGQSACYLLSRGSLLYCWFSENAYREWVSNCVKRFFRVSGHDHGYFSFSFID